MLREEWIHEPETDADILSYVMSLRNRMETAKELVEENTRVAQVKQKAYYDQKTRELNLQPGDKVLLLLPSSTKKFVARWQGPYQVTRCTGKVNFKIQMPDKGGCKQVFHINHLRKWQERTWSNKHQPQFGRQISQDQKEEVVQLLSQFMVHSSVARNSAASSFSSLGLIFNSGDDPLAHTSYG